MFEKPAKKLIIVGNKDTDVYCEFLSLLVSTKDDIKEKDAEGNLVTKEVVSIRDDSVDTAIWTDDIYRDNRAHTSSRQKTLFIGNKGCVESVIPNLDLESEDSVFGIYMGWLGNKAVIYIDSDKTKKNDKYKEFYEKYTEILGMYNSRIKFGSDETYAKTEAKEYFNQYKDFFKKHKKKMAGAGAVAASAGATATAATMAMGVVTAPVSMVSLYPALVGSAAIKVATDVHKNNALLEEQLYRYAVLKFYLLHLADFMELGEDE